MQVINKTTAPKPLIEVITKFVLEVLLVRLPKILTGILTLVIDDNNNCELLDVRKATLKKDGKSDQEIDQLLSEMTHVGLKYSVRQGKCVITGITGYEKTDTAAKPRSTVLREDPRVTMRKNEAAREERLNAIRNNSAKPAASNQAITITNDAKVSDKILNSILDFVTNVLSVRKPVVQAGTINIAYDPATNTSERLSVRKADKQYTSGMQIFRAKYSLAEKKMVLFPSANVAAQPTAAAPAKPKVKKKKSGTGKKK